MINILKKIAKYIRDINSKIKSHTYKVENKLEDIKSLSSNEIDKLNNMKEFIRKK